MKDSEFQKEARSIITRCLLPTGETNHERLIETISSLLHEKAELKERLELSEKKLAKLF